MPARAPKASRLRSTHFCRSDFARSSPSSCVGSGAKGRLAHPSSGSEQIDLAPDRARSDVDRVVENKAARRYQRILAQIQCLVNPTELTK